MTVLFGHVDKCWENEHLTLPYVRQPITDSEVRAWEDMGYLPGTVSSFTGMMYDNKNPMPEWTSKLTELFGLTNQTYTFYRMATCEIMPIHSDHYRTYQRLYNCTVNDVWRVVLMLEDWKPGHYLEVDGVGYVNWQAGDWFMWQGATPHAAANIGTELRYTLQVTGLKKESNNV